MKHHHHWQEQDYRAGKRLDKIDKAIKEIQVRICIVSFIGVAIAWALEKWWSA